MTLALAWRQPQRKNTMRALRLDSTDEENLEKLCNNSGLSKSETIRQCIEREAMRMMEAE